METINSMFSDVDDVQLRALNGLCGTLMKLGVVECMTVFRDTVEEIVSYAYNLTSEIYEYNVICACIIIGDEAYEIELV